MSINSFTKRPDRQGMTIIEILFAIAILGMVITVTYASALNAWRNAQAANQRTQAQYIAQDQIERLKAHRNDNSFGWKAAIAPGFPVFITDVIASLSDGFSMGSCDIAAAEACTFKMQPPAAFRASSIDVTGTDSTDYTVRITPTGAYTSLNPYSDGSSQDIATLAPDDIQAVKFEIVVTWQSAINSAVTNNLRAVTIITQKDIGQ